MHFTKMEGIGNDYVYVNGLTETLPDDLPALAVRMSRTHFGCASDGLILILPSDKADFRMQMFNNDGSESGMCGNGIRCVAKYCRDRGLTSKTEFTVETGSGVKTLLCTLDAKGRVSAVRVDMGGPVLEGAKIPSRFAGCPVTGAQLRAGGQDWAVTLVNVGNPHAVTFIDCDPADAPVESVGPALERDPAFPEKCNIEFAQVLDRAHVKMRVWERGTGETLACGTGACAVAVAAMLNGLIEREAEISLRGGKLRIRWDEADNHVYMTGPARFVYDGVWLCDEE
ncbi:MAG: diaminopimelate epimerase [Eubacteriales bacterium]|nr:diaminopimelate epimerase [Eubacteriales bacterium]